MTRAVPEVAPEATAAEILAGMRGRSFDAVAEVAVTRDGRLLGLIPLESVLRAEPQERASDLMDADPPVLAPGVDRESAAVKAVEHGEVSLAVTGPDGAFLGLVPPRRLLTVLLQEHEEDLARLGGFGRADYAARLAAAESIPRRFRHRLPWLLLGLVGALLSVGVVGQFEAAMTRNVTLAFFVPAVVYMADAVGTQTETLIVRGLSLGVSIRQTAVREVLTGVMLGGTVGLLAFPVAAFFWDDRAAAATLAIALGAACSTATGVAIALPGLLQRLGADPAYGSGPLATVIQDLLSILIYFMVAVALGA